MNSETLEIILAGTLAASVATVSILVGYNKYKDRRETRDFLWNLYEKEIIKEKPTLFNCYKLSDKFKRENPE